MTYQELKTRIQQIADESVLSDADFPDSEIAQLLQAVVEDARLELETPQVTPDDQAEEIGLEGRLTHTIFGISALQGQIECAATFSILGGEPRMVMRLTFANGWRLADALAEDVFSALASALSPAVRSQFDIPITALVLDSAVQSLKIGLTPNLSLNLSELPQYLQGVSVDSQFPASGFPSFDSSLSLTSFEIETRVSPMVLTYLATEVTLNDGSTWEPIGELVRFKDLRAELLLVNPLAHPAASITISTTAEISGTDIIASIELPSLDFQCFLAPGETIDILTLIEDIVDIPVPLPDIRCAAFSVIGEPRNSSFEFSASIETNWEIIPNLTLAELTGDFVLVTQPERSTEGSFSGSMTFGRSEFFVSADNEIGATGWQFTGGIEEGRSIKVADFIADLLAIFGVSGESSVDDVTEILGDLTITQLGVSFHTQTRDFSFACLMAFSLDDRPADLLLNIDLTNTTGGHTVTFAGAFSVGARQFSLSFESSAQASASTASLVAGYDNPEGEEIDLISDVVDLLSSNTPLDFPDPDLNLTTLVLYHLQLRFDREKAGAAVTTRYGIQGEFDWKPQFNLDGDALAPVSVRALVDLSKQSGANAKVLGKVSGEIESEIDGLEFLSLGACYELTAPPGANQLTLELTIGQITFTADYTNTNGTIHLEFGTDAKTSLTLGEVITFITSLIDPSIETFEFDPPWDFVTRFDLADLLSNLKVTVDFSRRPSLKKIGIELTDLSGFVPSELQTFLTVNALGLEYQSSRPVGSGRRAQKSTRITLNGSFLGASEPISWDPINEAPPEIPGQGSSVFDLRFLGMGQRIAFTQASAVNSIKDVMDLLRDAITDRETQLQADRSLALRNPLETFGDGGVIAFSPESEWLIGLDVTLLKVLSLTVIFNDPVIYGLRIGLSGELAKNFDGLQFEILYQRISDTVGKYHIDLTLPEFVRQLQMGAVSITLPSIILDIFTNGDFKVDLGFPWDFNFSRSFAIEVFPFTGAGGFYFNKLSAATATSTPAVAPDHGVFTPVYEFGLGLRLGVGKTFQKGPLNAEISITVQGMVEGVISWFNPADPAGERELYFKLSGGVAIVGRLYGEVDFGIISVSVEVIARAMIRFLVEAYEPIQIALIANVSVEASVKVAFITIDFSFSLTVRQNFTIDSPQGGNPPWLQ